MYMMISCYAPINSTVKKFAHMTVCDDTCTFVHTVELSYEEGMKAAEELRKAYHIEPTIIKNEFSTIYKISNFNAEEP